VVAPETVAPQVSQPSKKRLTSPTLCIAPRKKVLDDDGAEELLDWLGIPPRHQTTRDSMLDTRREGNELEGEQGLLALRKPWPGMLRTLYKEDDRFVETYFSKFGKETYFVGDASRKDEDGYFWVIGRVDDVINVSGHRLSTAEVESAIVSHPKVAEAAVIGQADEDSGQAICAFVTLEGDLEGTDEQVDEIREHVAKKIGKLARPKRIV